VRLPTVAQLVLALRTVEHALDGTRAVAIFVAFCVGEKQPWGRQRR
jgi:hypothetical protein